MIIFEATLEIITEEFRKSCNTEATLLLSRVCLSNHAQSTVSSLIPFVPHPDFLCRAFPASVERAKWNLLVLSQSAYGALFLHAILPSPRHRPQLFFPCTPHDERPLFVSR